MVIHLDQIHEAGYRVDAPVSGETLDAALQAEGHDTGFRAVGAGRLEAVLRKVGAGVLVKGQLVTKVHAPCRRCLQDVEFDVPVSFTVNLLPRPKVAAAPAHEDARKGERAAEAKERREEGESAGSFSLEDADEDLFDGKKIDLDPIWREQLLLALPMGAECREDCKGLCAQCGQNLNDTQCGCEVRSVDPRLASLKNIKLN